MGNNDPMFDLEDCEDVEFHNNRPLAKVIGLARN